MCEFQEGDKIPRTPHKLSAEKPTAFDIQFVVDGIRYAYGFSMNDVEFWMSICIISIWKTGEDI